MRGLSPLPVGERSVPALPEQGEGEFSYRAKLMEYALEHTVEVSVHVVVGDANDVEAERFKYAGALRVAAHFLRR
ncbi:protein of unknown function [Hyphomicrobium sp. 1Nfss2.1]